MLTNIRKVSMGQIEDLFEYLRTLEALIRDLDRRLTDLSEIELANNQLLASLINLSNQMMDKDVHIPSNDELLEELANYSARMENWEKN
tara:strand:+ start:277 stop:543 length:267 start_codon:yes stop_codon:yes gene_type:complete